MVFNELFLSLQVDYVSFVSTLTGLDESAGSHEQVQWNDRTFDANDRVIGQR